MLRSIEQFHADPNTGRMKAGFVAGVRTVTGVQALLQKVARLILTVKGSNYFDPAIGNVFASSIGGVQSHNDGDLKMKFQLGLIEIQDTIFQDQSAEANLEVEEKLKELRMVGFKRDPADFTNVEIDVLVITEANQNYILRV
jgi:hypothetical protein